ncbi:LysR family transcriptional regulator [Mycobacterium gordonae]|uniref:Probable hydrogen peroxide-inducible genes activator n=1 Tax=Mycobacterium gordonae TaxID=1778 RepID=A0A1X1VY66_MYCGO|nr:LysR family transcriptional regulator [Mycobacterium gordonae]MCV7008652.1 LysR family transcriptional regulator [Mycobacterium gordonae]ORV74861.1 LysR family transcriptional regulator [Mycobacterium gordonae]
MALEIDHLRCFVAVVDSGGFTDAAIELKISQPAVSRRIAALEASLGIRLLRRSSQDVTPTAAGERVLIRARRLLTDVDDLIRDAHHGANTVRIGHAWSTMGQHTVEFQHRWSAAHPEIELRIVRTPSPTGGLAERACDIAVLRTAGTAATALNDSRFDNVIVGMEQRYCALPADDRLTRRRQVRLADLTDRVLAVVARIGVTTPDLWPHGSQPAVHVTHEIDDWLDIIAAGRCFGVTTESTTTQYRRRGVVFRRLLDAPPVPIRLAWWRDEKHPATAYVVGLLSELYASSSSRSEN